MCPTSQPAGPWNSPIASWKTEKNKILTYQLIEIILNILYNVLSSTIHKKYWLANFNQIIWDNFYIFIKSVALLFVMLETTLLYKQHIILKVKNALFIDTHTFTCIKIKTAKWRIIFPSNSKEKWLLFKFVCWVSNKCYRHVPSVLPGLEVVRLHVLLCSPWLPAGAAEQRWPQCPAFPASAFCLGLWLKPNVPERAENTKVNRGDGAWPIRATCLEHAMVNQPYLSGTEDILQYLSSLWLQLFVLVQKVVLSGPLNDLKEKNKHVHAYQIF